MSFKDYYQVLQVHRNAEADIVEAAYKRLAKKYHPDVAKTPELAKQMQAINEAYDVLKNPEKRKPYNDKWDQQERRLRSSGMEPGPSSQPSGSWSQRERQQDAANSPAVFAAQMTLIRYMEAIQKKRYAEAYEWIAKADQKKMSLAVFEKWQRGVAQIFELTQFSVKLGMAEHEVVHKAKNGTLLRFIVVTTEKNALMDRFEQDLFEKKLVMANGSWQIVMDFGNPEELIHRFEHLNQLLSAKSVMKELVNAYSKFDGPTGLVNKKGFLDELEKEAARFRRYGRRFCVVMIGARVSSGLSRTEVEQLHIETGKIIQRQCRGLDTVGRWAEETFIVLMPETDLPGGLLAVQKLKRVLQRELTSGVKEKGIAFPAGIEVYANDIATTIDRLDYFYEQSKRHKMAAVQSLRGMDS